MATEQTADHCAALVRDGNRPRFIASLFAGAETRRRLFALYAWDEELQRIGQTVREPMIAAIRYQWWRDAIERLPEYPMGHPVLTELAAAEVSKQALQAIIDDRESASDGSVAEQRVIEEAARICGAAEGDNLIAAAAGAAFAMQSTADLQEARRLWRTTRRSRKRELPAYLPATIVDMRHPVTPLQLYMRMLVNGFRNRF